MKTESKTFWDTKKNSERTSDEGIKIMNSSVISHQITTRSVQKGSETIVIRIRLTWVIDKTLSTEIQSSTKQVHSILTNPAISSGSTQLSL